MMGSGQVGRTCLDLAAAKCSLDWTEALARGAFCNALVCLAVWMCMSCRGTGEKLLATMLPVAAFVAAGFEHSVANMYFVPAAMFVREFAADGFWTAIESPPSQWASITTWRFVAGNLVPVTIGNIVGGSVMVGVVYWLAYRRPGRA
jgi:formate transporter